MQPLVQEESTFVQWLILLFFMISIFMSMFYEKIRFSAGIRQIKMELMKLERLAKNGKELVINAVKEIGKPGFDPSNRILEFLEFFMIEPVDRDPFGIMKKLEHLINLRRDVFRRFLSEVAPNASRDERANLEGALEATIVIDYLFRLVRHYLILSERTKSYILVAQLQLQLPLVMRYAKAYFEALKAFKDGKPIGDGIGVLVATKFVYDLAKDGESRVTFKEIVEDTLVTEVMFEGRKIFVVRAKGPGAFVGKPGDAIVKIIEDCKGKNDISRIIMIDAALKLEGERSGEVAEGVGAAIGGIGVDRFKIEEIATKYGIPLDAIIIKESLEEAISPLKKEIFESVNEVIKRIKRIILQSTKPGDAIILAGIGNAAGIGFMKLSS